MGRFQSTSKQVAKLSLRYASCIQSDWAWKYHFDAKNRFFLSVDVDTMSTHQAVYLALLYWHNVAPSYMSNVRSLTATIQLYKFLYLWVKSSLSKITLDVKVRCYFLNLKNVELKTSILQITDKDRKTQPLSYLLQKQADDILA